jgi:hypothetical protein
VIVVPSSEHGRTFETVGWFKLPAESLRDWLVETWGLQALEWSGDLAEVTEWLGRPGRLRLRLLVPCGEWTAVLTDGPLGTDLGGLPELINHQFGVVTVRAVTAPDGAGRSGARIFEVFGATGPRSERHVYVAKDGGPWRFGQFGTPFDFEAVSDYSKRPVSARLTEIQVHRYLAALGAPQAIDFDRVIAVEARED